MYENLLPIGSVVLLKGANKRLMITGRIQVKAGDNKVYDLLGRPVTTYPDMPSRRGIYILNGQKFVVR